MKKSSNDYWNNRINRELNLRKIPAYLFFIVLIFSFGALIGKSIETLAILSSYLMLRYGFPKTWHAKKSSTCLTASCITFLGCIWLTVPISISLFGSIIIGFAITYCMYLAKDYIDAKIDVSVLSLQVYEFKYGFDNLCKKANLNERDQEIANLYFVEKYTPFEVWEWLCESKYEYIEANSVRQLLWRIGKKLKNVDNV